MQLICSRRECGFRAHDRYFVDKRQFEPGSCPRCQGPIVVVDDGTDTPVKGAHVVTDSTNSHYRRVEESAA